MRSTLLRGAVCRAIILFIIPAIAFAQADWPDCEIRSAGDGGPAIVVDGKIHSPMFFAANNQFGNDEILIEELALARDAGIALYTFNLPLHGSDGDAAAVIEKFHAAHPDGYFYVRMWMGAPQPWTADHPQTRMARHDGSAGVWPSPFSETWREMTKDALRDRIASIIEGPYADRFIGVLLTYLQTGEWFFPETDTFWDYSPAARDAFDRWLWDKYEWNRRLQSAWDDEDVSFDTVTIPSPAMRSDSYWGPFRHPSRRRAVIDHARFLSEGMVAAIGDLAEAVKAETRGRSLVGAFYGYTHELNHNGPRALAHSGHLALGKLLDDPNIDLVHAPYSYWDRAPGEPGHLHVPAASIAAHDKLLIVEDDTYTHLASPPPEGVIAPGAGSGAQDIEESRAVAWRNFGLAFGQGAGIWRFDVLSDGRWKDRSLWAGTGMLRRIAAKARSGDGPPPEVSVIVDEEDVSLLQSNTHPDLLEGLGKWRSEWARLGVPVAYYLATDLDRLPETTRVIAMPNNYVINESDRRDLLRFVEDGGMLILAHASGIYGDRGPDIDLLNELTGMTIVAEFDEAPSTIRSIDSELPWDNVVEGWNPRFVINDPGEGGNIIARYTHDDTGALAFRAVGDGYIVYSAVPRIPADTLSALIDTAGVHRYVRGPASVSVVGTYLFVHTLDEGEFSFEWPRECLRVERAAPSYPATVALASNSWQEVLPVERTIIYQCIEGTPEPEDTARKRLMEIIQQRLPERDAPDE